MAHRGARARRRWARSASRSPTCGGCRTGKPQGVTIDRHAAAASLRSNTYVLQNGKKPVSWDPLAGHYPTRDGRVMFLHTNHPHHRAGALRITGAKAETREALAEAVAKWDGLAIEQAIADGGCVGGLVRSREEWNAHPHGIAVAKLPLIDIVKIGEAPPRPLPKRRPAARRRARARSHARAGGADQRPRAGRERRRCPAYRGPSPALPDRDPDGHRPRQALRLGRSHQAGRHRDA